MVRMILPRATPGRAVPPPHLFEAARCSLQPFPAEQFSLPLLFCLRQAPTTYFTVEDAMKQRILITFVVLLLVPIASAQVYTITDLGSLSPTAINSWAQVVGHYNNQAYIWTFGHRRPLGTLPSGTFSDAASINDLGVVTGTADGPGTVISQDPSFPNQECTDLTQPFVWTKSHGIQGLGAVAPPFSGVYYQSAGCELTGYYGTGINDLGQVVGYVGVYATYQWALLWTRTGGITVFGGSWPPTFANAISNTGQIVGQNSQIDLNPVTIFLGHATSWKSGVATDLGTLGGGADQGFPMGYSSSANGVNDLGQIVGWSTTAPIPEDFHGWNWALCPSALYTRSSGRQLEECWIWGLSQATNLSAASKINFFGQVIGISGNAAAYDANRQQYEVTGRPFIWTQRNGMQDLNTLISATSGWVLNSATGINFWGQIVGTGTLNGQPHGFLLTPKNPFKL